MQNLVVQHTAESAARGLTDLPTEILLQIMLEVGAESIPTMFNLLITCKKAWGTWHGTDADPLETSQAAITAGDHYRLQMTDLMKVAVSPAVFPALLLAWATNKLMLERRGAGQQAVSLRHSSRAYYEQYSASLPADFGLRSAHEIQALDRATAGLAELYFEPWFLTVRNAGDPECEFMSRPFWHRAIMPMDELERHRLQRAFCMHEHFRCIERDTPGSFDETSLAWFSKAEVAQLLTIGEWLRENIGWLTCFIGKPQSLPRSYDAGHHADEGIKALRFVLHPVTVLALLKVLRPLRVYSPYYNRREEFRADVTRALRLEKDLTRADPYYPNRTVQIDLDALLIEGHRISPSTPDPHEQLQGLGEARWAFLSMSGSHMRDTDRFFDPDPGPREYIRRDEQYRALSGTNFSSMSRFVFQNDQRRKAESIHACFKFKYHEMTTEWVVMTL